MSQEAVSPPNLRRWAMFAVLLVGAFLPPLDFFIINVALPSIRDDLAATAATEQLVISIYAGLYAVTLITGGRLGDLYGRGRMFFLGLIGFAAASVLCGLALSSWALIAGRALQGVTAAIMAPQALASVQAIFPDTEKPLALSLYGAVFGLASVVGQALGGTLISLDLLGLGWRSIFLVNLPIAALVLLFGIPLLKETRARHANTLDLRGMALSILTLGALIVPLIEGREAGWPLWAWASLAAIAPLAVMFWRYESRLGRRGGAPLLDPRALNAPGLVRALVIALLFYAIAPFFLLFSIYLQNALHVDALGAGLVFLPFGVGFLLGPLSTPLFRRAFGAYVNPLGMGLEALGLLGMLGLIMTTAQGAYPNPVALAMLLFSIGFGQGLGLPTLMRIITGRVAPAYSGMIAGIASSALQVGTAVSVAVIGGVFYSALGMRSDSGAITFAFMVALACIALCIIAGMLLSLTLVRQPLAPKARPGIKVSARS
ncbi:MULTISPECIES: MFS transporter [unclassified Pseudomonas]|uniref:MFS transporter n=1 Tax=unclassified Pseudomonas TaxID=196821 RepID=UPI0035C03A1F